MREIDAATISAAVAKLAVQACCHLPADVRDAFRQRLDKEPSPVGRNILEQLLENADIAARDDIPICQDTGLAVVFAEVGQDVHITGGDFEAAIHEGVRRGYVDGYLRKSCVAEPLFERKNTGDNTPAVIHTRIVPGDGLTLRLAPKGAGSENKSVVKMLVPADGIEGVRKVVLDAVLAAGPNSCPPMVVGVGLGGTMEVAALCAKRAAARDLESRNPIPATPPSRTSCWSSSTARASAPRAWAARPRPSRCMWNGPPPTSPPCRWRSTSTAMRRVTPKCVCRRLPCPM